MVKMKRTVFWICVVILLASAILPYINAPKGYFIWDDINLIMMDYQIKSWHFMKNIFSRDFFGYSDNSRKYGYYRPIVTITYALDWQINEKNPAGYHWTNIINHILCTLLVFFILARILKGRVLVPMITALLFATNPIHTESVTWIAGRTDPIAALFFLLSFYLYIVYAERLAVKEGFVDPPAWNPDYGKKWRTWVLVLAALSFALAFLSKEMALTLPGILMVYLVIFITGFNWRKLSRYLPSIFLYALTLVPYFYVRSTSVAFSEQAHDPFEIADTIMTFVKTIALYTSKTLFPVYLTAYMQNELVEDVFTSEFLVPFVLIVIALWVMLRNINRNKPLAFAIAFTLLSYLPLSNFLRISGPADMGFVSAERFVYLPSFGVSLALALLFAYLMRFSPKLRALDESSTTEPNSEPEATAPGGRIVGLVASALLVVVLLFYGVLTYERNKVWYDNETFFKVAMAQAPNAPILYMLLGNVYSIEQKWDKAEETLKKAIEYISPRDREEPTWIYSDLAGVYAKQGLYDKALETMKLASKSKTYNSAVEFNYGEIYRSMGDYEKAAIYYRRSHNIDRNNPQTLSKLGMVLQRLGQYEQSNKAYLSAVNLLPTEPTMYGRIAHNYAKLGNKKKALEYLELSLRFLGDDLAGYQDLARQLQSDGLYELARRTYTEVAAMVPDSAQPYNDIGHAYSREGDSASAIKYYKKALEKDPEFITAHSNLGIELIKTKQDPEQGKQHLEKAIAMDPDLIEPRLALASYYMFIANPPSANDAYAQLSEAYKRDKSNVNTLIYLGVFYKNVGKPELAKKSLERVLELDPKNANAKEILKTLNI